MERYAIPEENMERLKKINFIANYQTQANKKDLP